MMPSHTSAPRAFTRSGLAAQPGMIHLVSAPDWNHSRRMMVVSGRYEPITITSGLVAKIFCSSLR